MLTRFIIAAVFWSVVQDALPRGNADDFVVPVNWARFKPCGELTAGNPDLADCGAALLNNARYNLGWMPAALTRITNNQGTSGRPAHDLVRPACSACYTLAVVLKTGLFDEKVAGCARAEAISRNIQLLAATAKTYPGASGKGCWDYPWQSALWAAQLGHGAWLLWDDLDAETRRLTAGVVEADANRFLSYAVPYWNGKGGDTKAEENAWNASVLSVAVAMMPRHPNAATWRKKCSELMISAYATEDDLHNAKRVDGKPVKDWLKGYNAQKDGSVINHGFMHPDYMSCVYLNLRAFAVQPLAGQAVPEAATFNADLVYRCFVTESWPAPPNKSPGGTIYRPGEPLIYYPQGTDWTKLALLNFFATDTHVHLARLDTGLPHRAADWMRLRVKRLLEMQLRHADRRIYADGEFDRWIGREQSAGELLSNAFLHLWLAAQDAPIKQANWLAP